MTTFLLVIHILVCIFLIGIVLIQGGKGAELGSAFGGGSSQTLFGGRGAATFLSKLTTVVAVVFMLTSLALAVISVKQGSVTESTVIDEKAPATKEKPASHGAAEKGGVKPVKEPASGTQPESR